MPVILLLVSGGIIMEKHVETIVHYLALQKCCTLFLPRDSLICFGHRLKELWPIFRILFNVF